MDKDVLQRALSQFAKNHPAGSGPAVFAPWGLLFEQWMGTGNGGKTATGNSGKKDVKKPVVDPKLNPQWTFQPNAYDQSPYGAAGAGGSAGPGPASQYTVNLPRQPWMLNPMGQQPQAPSPQEQQSQQYYQQWAPPYRTGQ
jgi:hypothetical protein